MNEITTSMIINRVLKQLNESNRTCSLEVPIGVSARHCHLCEKDVETLFGKGYQLTKRKDLKQPGQFAANETVSIVGPRGSIEKVRILGPIRKLTQIEVSFTDSKKLGIRPPVRESGNIIGSSPITIVGPKGSIYLKEGLILAQAHIHMPLEMARQFNFQDGDYVKVEIPDGIRPIRFEKVKVRISPNYVLEMHIDTDEANAGLISDGQLGKLIKEGICK
ncbi:phosphate propanoyltransferase [Bacillus sp. JJ1533]|uniref:phosphate propanoyltransferase n=1 Tax=Bacillus sp. JJ1533 TaxID=3122959 RepID=UPI002FFF4670